MDNNLVIKEVPFHGTNLLAVQEKDTGKIYVSVSYICKGIGLTDSQKDRQVANIQGDEVLKIGSKKLSLKFEGQVQNREILCSELDFLPLWLAKISITPKMKKDSPNVVQNLIEYQLKAKDVLSKAFLPQYNVTDVVKQYLDMSEEDRAILYFQKAKENKLQKKQLELQAPKVEGFDKFLNSNSTHTFTDVAKMISTRYKDEGLHIQISSVKLTQLLRDKGVLSKIKSHGNYTNYPNIDYEQYFNTTSVIINEGKEDEFKRTSTKVKPNGVEFIYNFVKNNTEYINKQASGM